ncbi:hypothetical protein KLEB273_gp227 [Bacillus phage vB_BauM_KLEB27-3]|nr:hypothetical protein KLEB273_gp227 [Bacillus phage vB_BauM_KLEB27-3]
MPTFNELTKREQELRKELETLTKQRKEVLEELDRIDSTFCHHLWDY